MRKMKEEGMMILILFFVSVIANARRGKFPLRPRREQPRVLRLPPLLHRLRQIRQLLRKGQWRSNQKLCRLHNHHNNNSHRLRQIHMERKNKFREELGR
jgi:hypothetical protein